MIINLDKNVTSLYEDTKEIFLDKVKNGYRNREITKLKNIGLSDDDIFIAEMLGAYKGLLNVKWLK